MFQPGANRLTGEDGGNEEVARDGELALEAACEQSQSESKEDEVAESWRWSRFRLPRERITTLSRLMPRLCA